MPLTIKTTGFEDFLDPSGGAYIRMLILGHHDTGKTRSASYWPKPLFMDYEPSGRMAIADRGVPYAECRSTQDGLDLITYLRQDNARPAESRKYLTLVVDTADAYQRIAMTEILRRTGRSTLSGWQDWGELDGKMSALLDGLMGLKMNVILNVHIKDKSEGEGDDAFTRTDIRLKGDSRLRIADDFALVGLMERYWSTEGGARVIKRRIRWHGTPEVPDLQDKSGRLPEFTAIDFTEGDYHRIFDTVVGEGNDSLEEMPEATELEQIPTSDTEPAGPDVAGGPVPEPKVPAPRKKPVAKKAAPVIQREVNSSNDDEALEAAKESAPQTVTPVATTETAAEEPADPTESPLTETESEPSSSDSPAPDEAEAEATVAAELGGEVIEVMEIPDDQACGFQPTHYSNAPAAQGCGQDLRPFDLSKVNLATVRAKTKLCPQCFDLWRSVSV